MAVGSLNLGDVVATFRADTADFQRGLKQVNGEVKTFGNQFQAKLDDVGQKMRSFGTKSTALLTLPIVGFGTLAVKNAAEAEGAFAKFNTVFGDYSDEMLSFVDELRKEMPTARTDIIKLAAGLQDLLVPLGLSREKATEMSQGFLDVANKIAAFNDVEPSEVLESIRAGLVGSSEPLAKFGTDARVTALEAVAMEEGLLKADQSFKDLEPSTRAQVRAQALLVQITKQNSDAINGFEENNDSFIRRFQEFKATFKEVSETLGKVLLPILDDLLQKYVLPLIKKFENLDDGTKKIIVIVGVLAAAIGPLILVLGFMASGISSVIALLPTMSSLIVFLATNPIGWLILAVGTLAYILITKWDKIKSGTLLLKETIVEIFNSVVEFFKKLPERIGSALSSLKDKMTKPFKDAFDKVKKMADETWEKLQKINPFHRESPSLVDNVKAGVKEIANLYGNLDIPQLQPQIGGFTAGQMQAPQFNQNVNIRVDQISDSQDIRALGREFGFRASLSPQMK